VQQRAVSFSRRVHFAEKPLVDAVRVQLLDNVLQPEPNGLAADFDIRDQTLLHPRIQGAS
jgi:hypothetical protein